MLVSLWARLHVLQTCWHLGHDQHRTPVSFGSGPWGTLERCVLLATTALLLGLWMQRVGAQVETEVNWAIPLRPLLQWPGHWRWRWGLCRVKEPNL